MSAKLTLTGVDDLLERLQELGGNVDQAARETIANTGKRVTADLDAGITRHNRTGRTKAALKREAVTPSAVKKVGDRFTLEVGFELPEGLPARYINKGTPTNRPKDPFMDKALNKSRIKKEQEEFLRKVVEG